MKNGYAILRTDRIPKPGMSSTRHRSMGEAEDREDGAALW